MFRLFARHFPVQIVAAAVALPQYGGGSPRRRGGGSSGRRRGGIGGGGGVGYGNGGSSNCKLVSSNFVLIRKRSIIPLNICNTSWIPDCFPERFINSLHFATSRFISSASFGMEERNLSDSHFAFFAQILI